MRNIKHSDSLILSLLIIFYAAYILVKEKTGLSLDEPTYLLYANNLLSGRYAPEQTTFLWAGPGYPLVLAFMQLLHFPPLLEKLLNAIFLFVAIIFLYRSLKLYISPGSALLSALFTGLYFPFFEMLPYRMTEPLTVMLISLIIYFSIRAFGQSARVKDQLLLIFLVAWLILTKFIMGYAAAVLLLLFFIYFLIRKNANARRLTTTMLFSIIFCLPYLFYTYHLTGKVFYWGTSGGIQLYWMSTPFQEEYGDWINVLIKPSHEEARNQRFKYRHVRDIRSALGDLEFFKRLPFDSLVRHLGTGQDRVFKHLALQNIQNYPLKYAGNWIHNISRMLFDTPYSYREKRMNWKVIFPNCVLLAFILISLIKIILGRQSKYSPEEFFLLTLILVYLAGSSLVSAYPRQFYIVTPVLLFLSAKHFFRNRSAAP